MKPIINKAVLPILTVATFFSTAYGDEAKDNLDKIEIPIVTEEKDSAISNSDIGKLADLWGLSGLGEVLDEADDAIKNEKEAEKAVEEAIAAKKAAINRVAAK